MLWESLGTHWPTTHGEIFVKDMDSGRSIIDACTDHICVLALHGAELFHLLLMVKFTEAYSYL